MEQSFSDTPRKTAHNRFAYQLMRLTNFSSFQPSPPAAVLTFKAHADARTHARTQRQCREYSHMHMRRLEPALINVVVCKRLRWVGAVFIHRDGNFAL